MSHNVFTIFNHGTDFHRDANPDELINQLSMVMEGKEARIIQTGERTEENPMPFALECDNPTYLICEGPGSVEVSAEDSSSGVHHAYPGKFNPIFGIEKGKGKSQNPGLTLKGTKQYWFFGEKEADEFQLSFMGNTAEVWRQMGRALGDGWDDNVYKAVWMLTHLKFEMSQPIDTVNIIGWSRGAVTCLKIANKLFEVFEDTLNVNIFAVDPVPGGYTKRTLDMLAIPPNVRNYLAVLALDADGGNFQPTDRTDMKLLAPKSQHGKGGNPDSLNPGHIKPHVHFLPIPGNHSDVVNANLSHPLVKNSAILCRHLAWQFLSAHGTPIKQEWKLSNDEISSLYNQMLPKLSEIAKAASTGGWLSPIEGFKTERAVRKHRGEYVHEPDKYINEHHRLCVLKQDYPPIPNADVQFTKSDWTPWEENKTLSLPQEQTHLQLMGITV
ncbi:hypothetical protein [Nostoc sp. TCL26-01]|uniref:hypothetical protein n=1 Tax=Nostoc sp. TCL26-01 TaxID=2576904 RepID=UPI0015BFB63A|nr:hypothetical protein [Nostoc sp. TCL26-01]QLE59610.1 hypothetical protein FD725_29570 [Nostoc sp. TCL26-01]